MATKKQIQMIKDKGVSFNSGAGTSVYLYTDDEGTLHIADDFNNVIVISADQVPELSPAITESYYKKQHS